MVTELPEPLQSLAIDHVAIAVADLELAMAPYRLLGVRTESEEVVADQGVRVRMLASDDSRLELLEPTAADTPVGRFLAKRGPGLHHLGLRVESLDRAIERLNGFGARFTDTAPRIGHGGSRIIFLHPSWTGGALLELVERTDKRHD